MYTVASLLDIHDRCHRNVVGLLDHVRGLRAGELDHELPGFGYPTVRLQLHHAIGAEEYWVGVLQGRVAADDDAHLYPDVGALEAYRGRVAAETEAYLNSVPDDVVNAARDMATWGGRTQRLMPAHVILRTQTHYYQHQGQVLAMCRLMDHPGRLLDFPLD